MTLVAYVMQQVLKHLTNGAFDPERPFTYCRICGDLYQAPAVTEGLAIEIRLSWSKQHAKKHTLKQHTELVLSRRWLTPEAAYRLAPYGVVDLIGLTLDEEVASAYAEAKGMPE